MATRSTDRGEWYGGGGTRKTDGEEDQPSLCKIGRIMTTAMLAWKWGAEPSAVRWRGLNVCLGKHHRLQFSLRIASPDS